MYERRVKLNDVSKFIIIVIIIIIIIIIRRNLSDLRSLVICVDTFSLFRVNFLELSIYEISMNGFSSNSFCK